MKSYDADLIRFKHILMAIEEIEKYIKDVSYEDFIENSIASLQGI